MPLKITYYYSACIKISACGRNNNTSILCDPWFEEPIYHGSWYQYPPYHYDPIEEIGDVDFIFISHIHPDHYDPVFLKRYFDHYGVKPILIQKRPKNYLLSKMNRDGLNPTPIDSLSNNLLSLKVVPVQPSNIYQIDSALAVKSFDGHSIVNLNDCNYETSLVEQIKSFCDKQIDICLMNYTPASSFPQCYNFSERRMQSEIKLIKSIYKQKFLKFKSVLEPKLSIPFAGQYILGGKNYQLNKNLGVCDAVDLTVGNNDVAVLQTNTFVTTDSLFNRNERRECYEIDDIICYSKTLANNNYEYEDNLSPNLRNTFESLKKPFIDCLTSRKIDPFVLSIVSSDADISYIAQYSVDSSFSYKLHTLQAHPPQKLFTISRTFRNDLIDYLCIYLEPKLIQAILVGQIHWNNIYVASLGLYDRLPIDKHRKDIFELLSLMRPIRTT